MTLAIDSLPVPLATEPDGTVRVAGTRVTLDAVINAFQRGASAEEIADAYTSLTLADVYATVTYYLSHRREVDAYLAERDVEARNIRSEIEVFQGPLNLRSKLMERHANRGS